MAQFEPKGWEFFDKASNREMMLIYEGPYKNWLAYKHPDGQWVTLRESTEADRTALTGAINAAHHLSGPGWDAQECCHICGNNTCPFPAERVRDDCSQLAPVLRPGCGAFSEHAWAEIDLTEHTATFGCDQCGAEVKYKRA